MDRRLQYGLNVLIPGIASGVTASRNFVGDVVSAAIPLTGGTFDASQLTLNFVSSEVDYNATVEGQHIAGSISTGLPVPNTVTGGALTSGDGAYELLIPIVAIGTANIEGVNLVAVYSGQVEAFATSIPEPSTLVLVSVTAVLFGGWAVANRKGRQ